MDDSFRTLRDDAIYLTGFYVETRYPGDAPLFSLTEARKALYTAKRVKDFVLGKIK